MGFKYFQTKGHINSHKGDYDFFLHNQCYGIIICLLIESVSQVSDVTHGPLVHLFLLNDIFFLFSGMHALC